MPAPILATKLYIPPPRPYIVPRPRLVERLNEGLAASCKLTLISASAGFGKTTLVSEWVATLTPGPSPSGRGEEVRVAWLSLDEGDSDPVRFLTYLVAALQTIAPQIGAGVLAALQSPQPLPTESILTTLLTDITSIADQWKGTKILSCLLLGLITTWTMPYLNLPDGYQHDPKSVQSADQADQRSLIHDDIGECGHLVVIGRYFSMSARFPKPAQPGVIQLTINLDLISTNVNLSMATRVFANFPCLLLDILQMCTRFRQYLDMRRLNIR